MGCSNQNDIINGTKRLAQLEHNNCGKKPEMRPIHCVFDSRNGRIIMEYYDHVFSLMRHRKHLLKIPFSFAYWVKPKLANIFAGLLAYYSSRAKIHHATAIRTKRSTSSGLIYTVGTQSVKDKAIRDMMRTVISPCPGIQLSHMLPTTQI